MADLDESCSGFPGAGAAQRHTIGFQSGFADHALVNAEKGRERMPSSCHTAAFRHSTGTLRIKVGVATEEVDQSVYSVAGFVKKALNACLMQGHWLAH